MPDPAVDLARSRTTTTLQPSESSASGFRRVIEVPPDNGKKKRGGLFKRRPDPSEYRDPYEQGLQAGGPALEAYYPNPEAIPTYAQPTPSTVPPSGLGASDPIYSGGTEMDLSWNEKRKLEKYAKQVQKDEARRKKEKEKWQRDMERRAAIEERKRLKDQEKELSAYRKASTHSRWNLFRPSSHTHFPEPPPGSGTNVVTPYQNYTPNGTAWGEHTYSYPATYSGRPLPLLKPTATRAETYIALPLPVGPGARGGLQPWEGYGIRKIGGEGGWTGMSRYVLGHSAVHRAINFPGEPKGLADDIFSLWV
ncbi:hypothetical protein FFLO_05622 [Filobasidium floriforme]|uniref:Uncharacterized protein n=1 Tax=Filobasidium floriforme TaxID=5210 RepID=A0A8K0JGZ7_9TREE|nr:hypothetical protein FFLO_05622 [Filobasidium floriforme]